MKYLNFQGNFHFVFEKKLVKFPISAKNFCAKYCMRNEKFRGKMDPTKRTVHYTFFWDFHQKP